MELLTTLGINWQLLLMQLLNFGILMAVLGYFVYKPLLKVIDDRKARIRKSMEDAAAIENQKKEIDVFKAQQFKKIDTEMAQYLESAKKQAEDVKKDILASAQKESDQLLAKAKQQLAEERTRMVSDMENAVANVVVRTTEKILEREFSAKDQERLMENLEKSIPAMMQ